MARCQTTISCKNLTKKSELVRAHPTRDLQLTYVRYDFEYEDDENDETGDVDIENKYYNAKQLKTADPEEAIREFLGVPGLENEKGDW